MKILVGAKFFFSNFELFLVLHRLFSDTLKWIYLEFSVFFIIFSDVF